ncbi:MAG TPA: hypothetical protein VFY12_00130, partial [Arenimonas sp.]|nr:hypothetical protein [Arenimonas sp.]
MPVCKSLPLFVSLLLAPMAALATDPPPPDATEEIERARPGRVTTPPALPVIDPDRVEPPLPAVRRESLAVPDRWRIMEGLGIGIDRWDPYNPNVLKGDKPFEPFARWGPDWFLVLTGISDSLLELRRLPIPVGAQSSDRPGAVDVFGIGRQSTLNQNLILSAAVIKGNTTFKPPDHELRLVLVLNGNRSEAEEVRALRIDPQRPTVRHDSHVAVQELFYDKHLRNVSARYDFDSLRFGIQPLISDFRGFVLQDNAAAVRLFGIRDNNHWQYNIAWLRRLEKDTNSGLNDLGQSPRRDDTLLANIYRQDWPMVGHTTQLSLLHNVNRESGGNYYNRNGFLERPAVLGDGRPRDYRVTYLGVNGDGHFGRWNLTSSLYLAYGQ